MSRIRITAAAAALALALAAARPALAYVGPGAGVSLIGSVLGLLTAIGTAVGFILLWPIRSYLRRRKARALLSLPGVTGVEDRGACSYVVEHAPGSDPREAVFRLAVARGWVLSAMTATQASLEDVFVRLTTREEPPAAEGV